MQIFSLISYIPFLLMGAVGFGFLVGFHELGHFLFCKLFGVRTPSFSIGFGPQLLKKKIGDTIFTLSAIPFGGYVEIAGSEEIGQGEQKESKSKKSDSIAVKPYYQKMLIIAGGIIFNLIFAYAAMTLVLMLGAPETSLMFPLNSSTTINKIERNSPAEKGGIRELDEIIGLQLESIILSKSELGQAIFTQKFLEAIQQNPESEATLTINRQNEVLLKQVTVGSKNCRGIIGAHFSFNELEPYGFLGSLSLAIKQVNFWISSTINALANLFKNKTVKGIGGPVMVISQMVEGAEKGFVIFLTLLAFISVNLAIMNIIPLPVFDGGQALIYTIEALFGRPIPDLFRNGLAYTTWFALIFLISWVTIQDILMLAKPYFGL